MVFHYLKFCVFHCLTLLTIAALLLGQQFVVVGFLLVSGLIIFGDALFGDDLSVPEFKSLDLLNAQLFLALPLISILMFVALWHISAGDPLGFGNWLLVHCDLNLFTARDNTSTSQHLVAVFFSGLMVSTSATVTGHELIHRTWSNTSVCVGRWLLAFSFDANFSVEHVYGHHRFVGTPLNPATAPRGRNVYTHIVLSTLQGNRSAWRIERQRLKRNKQSCFSVHNRCLRGYGMSLILLFIAFYIANWQGVLFFMASGLWAKALLEIVNYMEHYGIVRVPNKRVEPRHSWNTNRKMSCWAMFNLSRHSHHHAHGQLPFYALKPYAEAPTMINGYLATIFITLIPPLWFYLMKPKLAHWDTHFASKEEQAILADQASVTNRN